MAAAARPKPLWKRKKVYQAAAEQICGGLFCPFAKNIPFFDDFLRIFWPERHQSAILKSKQIKIWSVAR
jgi:hypothetical protein